MKNNDDLEVTFEAKDLEISKRTTPVVTPESKLDLSPAAEKTINEYEKFASNDGTFVRSKLDDETTVEAGNIMESQARAPAHQQHELAVEYDAPGFKQANALMTPRGSVHYDDGGSESEVNAGREHGEA